MGDSKVQYESPLAICLFFPKRHKMSVPSRLGIIDVSLKFPRSSCESQITCSSHLRKDWLPCEQRMLVRSWHRMFVHPLLTVDGIWSKQHSIVSNKLHERIASILHFRGLGERLFSLDHFLER